MEWCRRVLLLLRWRGRWLLCERVDSAVVDVLVHSFWMEEKIKVSDACKTRSAIFIGEQVAILQSGQSGEEQTGKRYTML